mgnify:CR=1 FL=1
MSKKQIIKRLLQIVIVLIGISFITFALTFMSPGDPVRNMYTATGVMPTEEMVQETREELGLNDPFLVQYTRWLKNCLKGDFGKSYSLNKPVTELLAARLWPTLKLTLMAMILMLVISVPLGMLSAIYKDKWIDYLVRGITFLGCAMPNFWVGLLLMLAFCVYINAFPVISSAGDFKSLFLPALTPTLVELWNIPACAEILSYVDLSMAIFPFQKKHPGATMTSGGKRLFSDYILAAVIAFTV